MDPTRILKRGQFSKTAMCKYFMQGRCQKGDECSFAHGTLELQVRPNLDKTSMCRVQLNGGKCTDPVCTFAHHPSELRSTSAFYKTKLCRYHLSPTGCKLGAACRHAHTKEELGTPITEGEPGEKKDDGDAETNKDPDPPLEKDANQPGEGAAVVSSA